MNVPMLTHKSLKAIVLMGFIALFSACDKDDDDDRDNDNDNRINPKTGVTLFATSNTSATFSLLDISNISDISAKFITSASTDADGIAYNEELDLVAQVNRTQSQVDLFANVSVLSSGASIDAFASSNSDFNNGRELAMTDSKIVVANDEDGNNQLLVYNYTISGITLEKVFDVNFNLWGIHIDSNNNLYAVVDNSDSLAVFEDFFNLPVGPITPDIKVKVEGIGRTHGITYHEERDIMFLTNIGDAGSDSDGGIHIITNFTNVLDIAASTGVVLPVNQLVIEGSNTMLGNPVDIAFDSSNNRIYVAERAKNGGLILGFNFPSSSGNQAPVYTGIFAGASSVFINQ